MPVSGLNGWMSEIRAVVVPVSLYLITPEVLYLLRKLHQITQTHEIYSVADSHAVSVCLVILRAGRMHLLFPQSGFLLKRDPDI